MNKKVVVVGGGITGLTAAHHLQQTSPHLDITLIEATNYLGGKIGTEYLNGFTLEWGPDCFLSRKKPGIALCEELGIAEELVGRNPHHAKTHVLRNGRLHRLPEGLTGLIPTNLEALENSTLLSKAAKERLAQEPTVPPEPPGKDESVAHFLTRRLGQETFENLIEPLMAGIYAGQAGQLSLAATFPQLRQLELKHGSLLGGLANQSGPTSDSGYPPFVSFPDGMARLVERLVDRLQGVTIRRDTAVTAITKTADGYHLSLNSEQYTVNSIQSSVVIVTTPAYVSGRLLQEIDHDLAKLLAAIPYASTALVNLAYNEADVPELDGYGYVIPQVEGREALACTWTSRKWHNRAPAGKVLLRLYIGRYDQPDVTTYDDGRLLTIAQDEIRETLGIAVRPLFHRIFRFPKAMPQYNLGHLERLAAIETRLAAHPGLLLAGAAFRGVGIPDCIASGEEVAERAGDFL